MPSFLSKVFGRKKQDGKEATRSSKRSSNPSLLEGKFEAVPPTISPTAALFPDLADKGKDKDKDQTFGLFRSKSRAPSPLPGPSKLSSNGYHLTLNLPTAKEEQRELEAQFEAETTQTLPDHVLDERMLTPQETLLLIDACSKAIKEHGGLETLGVMHPHWYSASPAIQRKLISLYILSLAPKSPQTTLTPTSDPPTSAFDYELRYTRSPHDIASVLRWGLRHLKLDTDSFGKTDGSSDELRWYKIFRETEHAASYPPNAFSNTLATQLPEAHLKLLISTLDIISSLASHAEANGISGSKLSKFVGLWLLSTHRSEESDDWSTFYARWERAGRVLEHVFLCWIRDEATKHQMPKRLMELIDHYPYSTSTPAEDGLLSRPRFSTRQYDALFVRIETLIPKSMEINARQHPVRLLSDALKSDTSLELGEHLDLWEQIKQVAVASEADDRPWGTPILSKVFSDDTVGLLSMIPADAETARILALQNAPTRKRSMSVGSAPKDLLKSVTRIDTSRAGSRKPSIPSPLSLSQPESPKDWTEFSTAGFGESNISRNFASTLLDKDIEVTDPAKRKPSKRRKLAVPIGRSARSSLDVPSSANFPLQPDESTSSPLTLLSKSTSVTLVQLDEAFIDFWRDALLDPISAEWPKFVIGQLKRPLELDGSRQVGWIVIEQVFARSPVSPARTPTGSSSAHGEKSSSAPLSWTVSPRPNLTNERKSSTLSSAVKRFSLFGDREGKDGLGRKESSRKRGAAKGGAKSPKIGELGEILPEESEEDPAAVAEKTNGNSSSHGAEIAATSAILATGATVAVAVQKGAGNGHGEVAEAPETESAAVEAASPDAPAIVEEPLVATTPIAEAIAEEVELIEAETPVISTPQEVDLTELEPVTTVPKVDVSSQESVSEAEPQAHEEEVDLTDVEPESPEQDEEVLPAAPEAVVQSGETPGPQLALDSTEVPVGEDSEKAILQTPRVEEPAADVAAFEPLSAEPVAFPQLDPEYDEDSSAGVDMDEVPIVEETPAVEETHPVEDISFVDEVPVADLPTAEPTEEAVHTTSEPTEVPAQSQDRSLTPTREEPAPAAADEHNGHVDETAETNPEIPEPQSMHQESVQDLEASSPFPLVEEPSSEIANGTAHGIVKEPETLSLVEQPETHAPELTASAEAEDVSEATPPVISTPADGAPHPSELKEDGAVVDEPHPNS